MKKNILFIVLSLIIIIFFIIIFNFISPRKLNDKSDIDISNLYLNNNSNYEEMNVPSQKDD